MNDIIFNNKVSFLKILPLSIQHLLAMFGATILVPMTFNINPATVLFFNGIGTLLYLIICKFQVPSYLGSSFAFISPVTLLLPNHYNLALGGFIISGLFFCFIALIIKKIGIKWLNIIFPPASIGAIIIVIGLELSNIAVDMASLNISDSKLNLNNMIVSLFTLTIAIFSFVAFKGFISIISILLGIISGYLLAYMIGIVNTQQIVQAYWFKIPDFYKPSFELSAILIILPAIIVIMTEHIGHLIAISHITKKDLLKTPGLHRSMFANGLSIILSGFFGSVPNTTYGENIGIIAITKIYNSYVIAITAFLAILLSCIGKLSALIQSIPIPVIGGISILLYGIISVSGIRILIDEKVNYNNAKNLILTSVILIIGVSKAKINIGYVELKGMTLSAVFSILFSIFFKLISFMKNKFFFK